MEDITAGLLGPASNSNHGDHCNGNHGDDFSTVMVTMEMILVL